MLMERYRTDQDLDYGWSEDKKRILIDSEGARCLSRISPVSKQDHARQEYAFVEQLFKAGLPTQKPIELHLHPTGELERIYGWIEGVMLENVIKELDSADQLRLGYEAGRILMSIHEHSVDHQSMDWQYYFERKIDRKLQAYKTTGIKIANDHLLKTWIAQYRYLLEDRPIVHQHGDYHPGNMVLSQDNQVYIIDFDRHSIGDPYEEFSRISITASVSPCFASGQILGYFDGKVPEDFFRLMKLYGAINAIGSIPWASSYSEEDVSTMLRHAHFFLTWYETEDEIVPTWFIYDR